MAPSLPGVGKATRKVCAVKSATTESDWGWVPLGNLRINTASVLVRQRVSAAETWGLCTPVSVSHWLRLPLYGIWKLPLLAGHIQHPYRSTGWPKWKGLIALSVDMDLEQRECSHATESCHYSYFAKQASISQDSHKSSQEDLAIALVGIYTPYINSYTHVSGRKGSCRSPRHWEPWPGVKF